MGFANLKGPTGTIEYIIHNSRRERMKEKWYRKKQCSSNQQIDGSFRTNDKWNIADKVLLLTVLRWTSRCAYCRFWSWSYCDGNEVVSRPWFSCPFRFSRGPQIQIAIVLPLKEQKQMYTANQSKQCLELRVHWHLFHSMCHRYRTRPFRCHSMRHTAFHSALHLKCRSMCDEEYNEWEILVIG